MNLDYYRRQGVMHFNNRPTNRMGKSGTPSAKVLRVLDREMSIDEVAEAAGLRREIAYQTLYRLAQRGMAGRAEGRGRFAPIAGGCRA